MFNSHPSNDMVHTEHYCTSLDHPTYASDWSTAPQSMTSDDTYGLWMPDGSNALGLYEMDTPDSIWTSDLFACLATTGSSQTDSQFSNIPSFRPPPRSDSVPRSNRLPTSLWSQPSVREDTAFFGAEECLLPYSFHSKIAPQSHPIPMNKHVSASRSLFQPTPLHPRRYAPYAVGSAAQRSPSPGSIQTCQWIDDARPCGTVVTGTKLAIGKHLRTAHGIRLKADKTFQVCRWPGCRKEMLRESIVRHVLTVHLHDKVLCASCGTRFARRDSLQRHERTQCVAKREDAGK